MDFTDRVIKETMRVFPAGPLITRYISGDIDLGNDVILPKGASVAIPILYIHRCAKFWNNPLKFDPDRFLVENVGNRHPLTYLGFSQGVRSCIGKHI
nr:unnamed protein product [Callosobruchus analis]